MQLLPLLVTSKLSRKRLNFFLGSGQGFVPNLTRAAPPWWRLARYAWCEVFDKAWVFKRQKRSHLMCGRFYKTQNKANRVASRLDSRQIGNKVSSRTNQDFESLPDSKSP